MRVAKELCRSTVRFSRRREIPDGTGGFFGSLTPRFDIDRGVINGAIMRIVPLIVGPLFIAIGLFWFGQGTGLLLWPHNAAMVDSGAGIIALGIDLTWAAWR